MKAGDGGMLPKEGPPIACDIVFCKTIINPDTNKPMLITLKKAGDPGPLSYKMLDPTAAFIMYVANSSNFPFLSNEWLMHLFPLKGRRYLSFHLDGQEIESVATNCASLDKEIQRCNYSHLSPLSLSVLFTISFFNYY